MAEIVLHFKNRRNENATATVQTPVVIRFQNTLGQKMRVVVRDGSGIKSITLAKGLPVPASAEGNLPPNLMVEDDVGPISDDAGVTTDSPPPPPPPGGGPGVCYEDDQQTFCW